MLVLSRITEESRNLKEKSFLVVCLGYQFHQKIPVDGKIYLETSSNTSR